MKFTGGKTNFVGGVEEGFNPAIFIGVEQLEKSGQFVAKFKVCEEKPDEGLVPKDFVVQTFLSIYNKENPDPYKLDSEVINQMFEAMGLANRIEPGEQVELPTTGEVIPEALSVPVKVLLKKGKQGFLQIAHKDYKWFWNLAEDIKPEQKTNSGSDLL